MRQNNTKESFQSRLMFACPKMCETSDFSESFKTCETGETNQTGENSEPSETSNTLEYPVKLVNY